MNKKAQAEIIGLMIIVIIITLAMLFYLSYVTTESDSSTKSNIRKEFIDNELSMSFVQAAVRTTVPECGNLPLDILIKDCGLQERRISCAGMTTCEAVSITLETIKNETLDVWDKSYSLLVDYGETSQIDTLEFDAYDCAEGTVGRRAPGVQPIPYYPEPGTAFLELAICKK
ncbi:MAG: hypothetical protein KC535_00505 [Nanoarchaeota archaeon]|nr:hypothetical protein [Nanoarchaeota archaeon]